MFNVHSPEMVLTLLYDTLYGGVPAVCALITFVKSMTFETVQYSDFAPARHRKRTSHATREDMGARK
jgi:hypothetical protein